MTWHLTRTPGAPGRVPGTRLSRCRFTCVMPRMRGAPVFLQRSAMMKNILLSAGLATALVCAAPAAWAQGQSSADQGFLKNAIEANFAEIEMGKLAQQKGASEDVKS